MKSILIICPRFPPTNAADSHRVRLSLPYYAVNGWEATVLATKDDDASPKDDMLEQSLPAECQIVRVRVLSERLSRLVGFGQLEYRSFIPLLLGGMGLLRRKRFDVVLFSSTVFLTFILGPIWKRLYGCKIVYDYQDPWYYGDDNPYSKETVPGKWWKFRLNQAVARVFEPIALGAADHIISVSQGYVDSLCARYTFLSRDRFTVLPFPASKRDYEFVYRNAITHSIFKDDGKKHWAYAGRGGHDMQFALKALFSQLASLTRQKPELRSGLSLYFVGTSYAPVGRSLKTIEPVATSFGVTEMVIEQPDRIPYFEALSFYSQSDLILIIGSQFSDYTASKLFNCVLSGKKILALFHRDSLVSTIVTDVPNVFLATFDSQPDNQAFEEQVMRGLLWAISPDKPQPYDENKLAPWLADASTRMQCEIFSQLSPHE